MEYTALLLAIAKVNGHPDPAAWAKDVADALAAPETAPAPAAAPEGDA